MRKYSDSKRDFLLLSLATMWASYKSIYQMIGEL